MASFQIATIYKDHATLRGYEKCGLAAFTRTCGSATCARNSGWRVRLCRDVVGADLRAARREPGCQPATGRLGDPALLPPPQSATRWRSALSTTSSREVCLNPI